MNLSQIVKITECIKKLYYVCYIENVFQYELAVWLLPEKSLSLSGVTFV